MVPLSERDIRDIEAITGVARAAVANVVVERLKNPPKGAKSTLEYYLTALPARFIDPLGKATGTVMRLYTSHFTQEKAEITIRMFHATSEGKDRLLPFLGWPTALTK